MSDGRLLLSAQLKEQALACEAMGSPLYAGLLHAAARDAEAGGPTWRVLSSHLTPGRGNALALRLMAAVHRLVLTGQAPELARHYPSAGGDALAQDAWAAFESVLERRSAEVSRLSGLRCQTNEVGRAAALVFGFLDVAASTGLPLRVLEVGASAGLNLRFDHFRYGGAGAHWGDAASPVDLVGLWAEGPDHLDAPLRVVERRGCDLHPVDAGSDEGKLALAASIWADQRPRFARLQGALELAARISAVVDAEPLDSWVPRQLAEPTPGMATIVYHSVVDEYLPEASRHAFHAALATAGRAATKLAPLAWLRLEPISAVREHGVRLVTWPGGGERWLATCGAHGSDARPFRSPLR
jgi:hypothetical protein